jgi:hypothetical protein
MGRRSDELQVIFETILNSRNVYFQPPPGLLMSYPAIVYELSGMDVRRADDTLYKLDKAYQVTVIDKDPDSTFPDEIIRLPKCAFERAFQSDNLNHWVFKIYY